MLREDGCMLRYIAGCSMPTHREDGVRGEEKLGLPRGAGGRVDNVRVVDEVDVLAAPRLRFGRILVS